MTEISHPIPNYPHVSITKDPERGAQHIVLRAAGMVNDILARARKQLDHLGHVAAVMLDAGGNLIITATPTPGGSQAK